MQMWMTVSFLASSVLMCLYTNFTELFLVMFPLMMLIKHLHSGVSFLVILVLLFVWVTGLVKLLLTEVVELVHVLLHLYKPANFLSFLMHCYSYELFLLGLHKSTNFILLYYGHYFGNWCSFSTSFLFSYINYCWSILKFHLNSLNTLFGSADIIIVICNVQFLLGLQQETIIRFHFLVNSSHFLFYFFLYFEEFQPIAFPMVFQANFFIFSVPDFFLNFIKIYLLSLRLLMRLLHMMLLLINKLNLLWFKSLGHYISDLLIILHMGLFCRIKNLKLIFSS